MRRASSAANWSSCERFSQPHSCPEADRDGRARPRPIVDAWLTTSAFFVARADACRSRLARLQAELRPVDQRIADLKTTLHEANGRLAPRRFTEVFMVVDQRNAGTARLSVSYSVAGPTWSPVYDLHYDPKASKLEVYAAALVRQQTGERWTNAKLVFSTGIPDVSIALPKLLTWTLGERDDFTPTVRPAASSRTPPSYPAPQLRRAPPSEDLLALQRRLSEAIGAPGRLVRELERTKKTRPKTKPRPAPARQLQRYAATPAAPVVESIEDEADEVVVTGAQASSTSARRAGRRAYARKSLPLTQATLPKKLAGLGPTTPAALAAGVEYLYEAPARFDIASNQQPIRVPIGVERFDTEAFHQATPGLATTAYLRVRLTNRSSRPMLAGPTQIFVGDRFIGEGRVNTVFPKKQVEFGLGADENIKLKRRIVPDTREEGVFTTHQITRYRTVIEAANYHRRPVRLKVLEPVPKSRKDDIEIKILSLKPQPAGRPTADNVYSFVLDLAPGATEKIEIIYEIDRPKSLRLRQR